MAKDYFQDVVPPDDDREFAQTRPSPSPRSSFSNDRSIRNVNIPQRQRPMNEPRHTESGGFTPPPRRRSGSRWWLWAIAFIALLLLALILVLFVFRNTTVTITPQSQPVVFDQGSQFTAYPAETAATGTLTYTVQSTDLQESTTVPASGSEHADVKASGSITVVNDYSSQPVKLIKDTRFQTADGLIFRAPVQIEVPGKTGTQPGKVTVTVVADQPGDQYNIAPQARFTVPGLQSTPQMYSNIYAYSTASTTGGFSGDRPAVDQSAAAAAVATLKTQLAQKAQEYAQSLSTGNAIALPGLAQITYQDLPNTGGSSSSSAQLNESAHVVVPVFPAEQFANTVAQTVSADAQGQSVLLVPGKGFAGSLADQSTSLGDAPLTFSLMGQAELVWSVDTKALAQALAGKSQAAFQTITSGFPGVKEAHARIEPFWESSFPSNPSEIHVTILQPTGVGSSASGSNS